MQPSDYMWPVDVNCYSQHINKYTAVVSGSAHKKLLLVLCRSYMGLFLNDMLSALNHGLCRKQEENNPKLQASQLFNLSPAFMLVWLIRSSRRKPYVPPKHRVAFVGLHGVIFHKAVFFIATAMST